MNNIQPPANPILSAAYIPGLNTLRAISVLLVMFSHYGFGKMIPGALGVTIFFFISGFLITTLAMNEVSVSGKFNLRQFWVRRFLRLHPELIVFIFVSGFGLAAITSFPREIDFIAGLFYFSNYYHLLSVLNAGDLNFRWPHLWSLAVEEHYYLFYPLLFSFFFYKPKLFARLLLAITVVALIWRIVIITFSHNGEYTYEATDARIDSIIFGCLCSLLLWWPNKSQKLVSGHRKLLPLALGGTLIFFSLVFRDSFFRETWRYSIQGVALTLIFVGIFSGKEQSDVLAHKLEHPLAKLMGQLSYAAYLWHFDFLILSEKLIANKLESLSFFWRLLNAFLLILCTFAVAYVSRRLIEMPILRFRRKLGSHQ
jgi:peptidoglycan/LPS O-acetylase OafA/YrhL